MNIVTYKLFACVMLALLMSFPFIAYSDEIGGSCEVRIDRLELSFDIGDAICISAETTASELRHADYILAYDAYDLSLSTDDILEKLGNQRFNLVIDGVCAGKCARLLLPLAGDVTFTKDSFVALTDNSINSLAYDAKEFLGWDRRIKTVKINEIMSLNQSYKKQFSDFYVPDVELIERSGGNVTHLTWNSFVQQSLSVQLDKRCLPVKSLAVVLSRKYLVSNSMGLKSQYVLPDEEDIVNRMKAFMPNDTLFIKSYENLPFFGCP